MSKHTHDYIDGRCVLCGTRQWQCITCGHSLADGEHCYLPRCVEDRIRAARRMGWSDRKAEGGDG